MESVAIDDPKLGIILYKNMLPKEMNLISKLEKIIAENEKKKNIFQWRMAMVGDQQIFPEYRDCFDFKVSESQVLMLTEEHQNFKDLFNSLKTQLDNCLHDYQKKYNIEMNYMEAINFVKYGVGQHFQVHADHGFSYICTISSVAYLNDDYSGGELYFPNFDLKIKPEYGDIVFFPSTFIYSHASLPVKDGIKYSAVTMFDYNDRAHKNNDIRSRYVGK